MPPTRPLRATPARTGSSSPSRSPWVGSPYATSNYLAERMAEIDARATDIDMVRVVVAKTSLPAGASITPTPWPCAGSSPWAHSGAITPDQFSRAESLVLAYPAAVGETILWAQLEGRRAPVLRPPAVRSACGHRAGGQDQLAVRGMVEPGDRIDIVVSARNETRGFTFTLLQSIPVLATGGSMPTPRRMASPTATPPSPSTPHPRTPSASSPRADRPCPPPCAPPATSPVSTAITDGRKLLGLPDGDGRASARCR